MTQHLTRRARALSLYTGLKYSRAQWILAHRGPAQPLIPRAATLDQRCLEGLVLERLGTPWKISVYPWGIKSILPTPHGISLEFEGDHRVEMVTSLLPRRYDNEISGVPGLRELGWHGAKLHLGLLGSSARLTITGISRSAWSAHLLAMENDDRESRELCHLQSPRDWTPREWAFHHKYIVKDPQLAWLGSDLLRRLAVFQAIGRPVYARTWVNYGIRDEEWCFDLTVHPLPGPCPHEELLQVFTDPDLGMPLILQSLRCRGGSQQICVLDLVNPRGPGRLNLRVDVEDSLENWAELYPEMMAQKQAQWPNERLVGRRLRALPTAC